MCRLKSWALGGWLRSLAFVGVALLAPPCLSAAVMRGTPLPRFSRLLGPAAERIRDPLARLAGALMIATTLLAIVGRARPGVRSALPGFSVRAAHRGGGAVFHAQRDDAAAARPHGAAELAAAGVLALSVPYIVLNESFANWQSLWLCAALGALAFSLARVRDAQS